MSTPVLATKLYIPLLRPKLVPRPRLIERLNEGFRSGHPLTLISAPAGFGKTTLVSEWVAGPERPEPLARVAWLSLDEGDSALTRFLTYFVAALQTMDAAIGKGVLGLLQAPQPPPTESLLTALLNEIATFPDHFILVLDDYHVIDSRPADASASVDDALTFLVEHLPPAMHLVIASREDPQLPLARLRARGQLTELRATDLRFTPAEAAEFLNQVMRLNLAAEDLAALEARTEGWIAGLQLAALSMQGRSDTVSFIRAFTGSHRFVLDYLVEEVLQRQPERVRRFLLQTALLDRLSGPLCDAVCSAGPAVAGQEDGRGMLEALERSNLFVIPLDDHRQWYRYHRLFAEVLQARAQEAQPNEISGLHRRASAWYQQNGLPSEAIRHALAAGDFERAAGLIELAWPETEASSQSTTWLGWVKALPDELVRARPVLSAWYAFALLPSGEMEAAEARLADAERWLESADHWQERLGTPSADTCLAKSPPSEQSRRLPVADEDQFRSLPVTIATGRAYLAQARGDGPNTVKYARRVLDLLPEGDPLRRGQATALLGLTYWASGDLEAADRIFADYTLKLQSAGNLPDAISTTFVLTDIRLALGQLREAARTLQQLLQFVMDRGEPLPPETADLFRGLGELYRERGDLEAAAKHLLRSKELGEHTALFDWQHRLCVAQARLKQTQGDLDGALDLLNQAERLFIRTPLPDVRPLSAMKARIWIAQGRLTEALEWARERGLSADDTPSYLREFEQVTLARALIARYKSDREAGSIHAALALLERLLLAAEAGRRLGSVIEILGLQALAHEAQGNLPPALISLKRALKLAEPEGYVRLWVDEGPPMARLLHEAAYRGLAPAYTQQLLAAFCLAGPEPARPAEALSASVEPLSERELEVLHHIAEGLSNREIADRLYLSLYTVKAHARSIYAKLDANSRTQAVAKARELGILPRV